jgi:hypothetical protein
LKNTPLDIARKTEEKWERVEFFTQSFFVIRVVEDEHDWNQCI